MFTKITIGKAALLLAIAYGIWLVFISTILNYPHHLQGNALQPVLLRTSISVCYWLTLVFIFNKLIYNNFGKITLKLSLLGLFVGGILMVSMLIFTEILFLLNEQTPREWQDIPLSYWIDPIFAPPILEEIFFRGCLLTFLIGLMRPALAVVITSAIFLAFHLPSLLWIHEISTTTLFLQCSVIFFTSVMYSVVYLLTKSLIAPILGHIGQNLSVVIASY